MTITDAQIEAGLKALEDNRFLSTSYDRMRVALEAAALAAAQAGAPDWQQVEDKVVAIHARACNGEGKPRDWLFVIDTANEALTAIRALRPPAAPAESDAPGTPLSRLNGIAEFVVARGLCTGLEAKPPELFLMEAYDALSASEPAGAPSEAAEQTAYRFLVDYHNGDHALVAGLRRNTDKRWCLTVQLCESYLALLQRGKK